MPAAFHDFRLTMQPFARKAQAGHGVSVAHIRRAADGSWQHVKASPYNRRIHGNTPITIQGPAAGHALMRTAADPAGRTVLGTLNNCASGMTPWGTYLSGEENFAFYFDGPKQADADQRRWGLRETGFYRWPEHDERWDAKKHPNEFHRFGWVVEIDPMVTMPGTSTAATFFTPIRLLHSSTQTKAMYSFCCVASSCTEASPRLKMTSISAVR